MSQPPYIKHIPVIPKIAGKGAYSMENSDGMKEYRELYNELESYKEKGVSFKLDGITSSPMQIVTAHMVKEDACYMRDYDIDNQGCIKTLTFVNVGEDTEYRYM